MNNFFSKMYLQKENYFWNYLNDIYANKNLFQIIPKALYITLVYYPFIISS